MDILVKHNGTTITSHVISYEREHKICTGIGTLTIEIKGTTSETFDPWDSIDIYENGDFKVRYYISEVRHSVPAGVIVLDCQDESKRLVDYFIPDTYVIDFPSYTRTWIEQFLTEAGISYNFNTASSGNLLSNMTQLGLQSGYEQILTLLQLSGWYMFFDGNGVAQIGPLETDLASSTANVGKTDILTISRLSDDKMLRNRALVLGAFDIFSMTYASADVTVHTRWNYDRNDIRSMVVSNSNIPNSSSAYGIANMLIKEFARITIEKRLEVWGARNFTLGDALRVNSNVWRGKGLITTFGVRMSKDGLVTFVTLDERCPRLFGFFDFGDYVYVSTFGDGIWRKHLKFDPTWYDFSDGLTTLEITDLHINNGVFGSVGSSGQMYYATHEADTWHQITVTGLQSSSDDILYSGNLNLTDYSGIMARAVIVDKANNLVKFGVDNWSGLNYGDYFLNYSGWLAGTLGSGILSTGVAFDSTRGWILEFDPYTGNLVGGLGSGIYPIHYSGSYDVHVIDLENDGFNDYVSIHLGGGSPITAIPDEFEWGYGRVTDKYSSGAFVALLALNGESIQDSTLTMSLTNGLYGWGASDHLYEHRLYLLYKVDSTYLIQSRTFIHTGSGPQEVGSTQFGNLTSSFPGWTPVSTITVAGLRSISAGKFRFLGIVSGILKVYEATENGSGLDIAEINSFPSGYAWMDQEDDKVLISVPVTGDQVSVLVYSLDTGVGTTVVIVDRPDRFSHSIGSCLVDGNVHSVGVWVEENGIDFDYYEVNGIGPNAIGEMFHSGTGTMFMSPPFKCSQDRSAGMFGTTGGDGPVIYVAYPGLGKFVGVTADLPGSYSEGSPYTYKLEKPGPTDWGTIYVAPISLSTPSWSAVDLGDFLPITVPSKVPDVASGALYILAYNSSTGKTHVVGISADGASVSSDVAIISGGSGGNLLPPLYSSAVGNCFVRLGDGGIRFYILMNNNPILGDAVGDYMVLKRDGSDYTLIEREAYPIREDISNQAPVFTVGSGDLSFKSNYVYGNDLQVIYDPFSPTASQQVDDYRYTLLEPTLSGIVMSGVPAQQVGMYVHESGIFTRDIFTYSGAWEQAFQVPSGYGFRIETSNYGLGGQYIFITTSGFVQNFYQKDPQIPSFVLYSGLPQSRATMIRLDDRI